MPNINPELATEINTNKNSINVKWFGAKEDGETDLSRPFNRAVAVAAGGFASKRVLRQLPLNLFFEVIKPIKEDYGYYTLLHRLKVEWNIDHLCFWSSN